MDHLAQSERDMQSRIEALKNKLPRGVIVVGDGLLFQHSLFRGDLCKKPFPRQPKPQHRFSAVFVSNIHRFYPNTPLILPGYPIIRHPGRLLGGNRHT